MTPTELRRHAAQQRAYRLRHGARLNAERRAHRKANPEIYSNMDRVKKGLPEPTRPEPKGCEYCGCPPSRRSLDLDHDHATGSFRGWLCSKCNRAIGLLGDSVEGVQRALNYLTGASS